MAKQLKKKKEQFPEPRINDELKGNYDVRVIYTQNEQQRNEVMHITKALAIANSLQLDLIEINGKVTPPIVRVDNYEKWLYNEKKKAKENKQKKSELKEIQLSVNIAKNDMEVKLKKAKEFIENGDKVKVVLTLRGREKARREESKRCLYEFLLMINDIATPETMPKDEGNRSIVILKRKK